MQNQIILIILSLINFVKVAAFKVRIEVYLGLADQAQPFSSASLCQEGSFRISDNKSTLADLLISLFAHRIHSQDISCEVVTLSSAAELLVYQSLPSVELLECK